MSNRHFAELPRMARNVECYAVTQTREMLGSLSSAVTATAVVSIGALWTVATTTVSAIMEGLAAYRASAHADWS